jgi:hypothetical protein
MAFRIIHSPNKQPNYPAGRIRLNFGDISQWLERLPLQGNDKWVEFAFLQTGYAYGVIGILYKVTLFPR